MRILSVNNDKKKYGRFSMPGFTTNSIIRKILALVYYLFIIIFIIIGITNSITSDIGTNFDTILQCIMILLFAMLFILPIVIIGFSDYYDWHGIKLFLIIMIGLCIITTLLNVLPGLFSEEYMDFQTDVTKNSDVSFINYLVL